MSIFFFLRAFIIDLFIEFGHIWFFKHHARQTNIKIWPFISFNLLLKPLSINRNWSITILVIVVIIVKAFNCLKEFVWLSYTYMCIIKSYYKSSSVCLFVCLFVPYLLRGPLTDLRQTWWVYAGGPRNCPWGVLFRKRQRVDGSTGHFRFPLYYIYASLTPHSCKRRLCCYCI